MGYGHPNTCTHHIHTPYTHITCTHTLIPYAHTLHTHNHMHTPYAHTPQAPPICVHIYNTHHMYTQTRHTHTTNVHTHLHTCTMYAHTTQHMNTHHMCTRETASAHIMCTHMLHAYTQCTAPTRTHTFAEVPYVAAGSTHLWPPSQETPNEPAGTVCGCSIECGCALPPQEAFRVQQNLSFLLPLRPKD